MNKRPGRKNMRREKPEFEQKLLDLARVTRVVKGGRRFRFRATLVIGDRKGRVGVGVAKGADVSDAIQKAYNDAKKSMITVKLSGNTISHDVKMKLGSAKVLLKPASEGRGVIAGGAVRAVVDLAGIRDIVSKSLGTSNKLNVARATIEALKSLKAPRVKKEKEPARDASQSDTGGEIKEV
jgi:small subunit ribosomal protein S5